MKLTQIQEASYMGEEEGTLKWLLSNFFDGGGDIEYENGIGKTYRVKKGFEVWGRGTQVADIEVYPNGDYQFGLINRSTGNVTQGHLRMIDIRVTQVKQVWPKE